MTNRLGMIGHLSVRPKPTATQAVPAPILEDEIRKEGPSRSKFHKGVDGDAFAETVASPYCQLQAVLTTNYEKLVPAVVRFKGSPHDLLRKREMWFSLAPSHVASHTSEGERTLHHHIYTNKLAVQARQAFLTLAVDMMSQITLHCSPDGIYSWELPSTIESFKWKYIDEVKSSKLPFLLIEKYSIADITSMLVDLLQTFLANSNYNGKAAKVGCSLLNLAQALVHLETGTDLMPGSAKLRGPFAEPLLGGNEEESDNVFIEYVSCVTDELYSMHEFNKRNIGTFLSTLLENGTMPRPTKSSRPDWVLQYRGCPLAYGEGKSKPGSISGLYYTTLCAANILNFMPMGMPGIVLYSNNQRFIVQTVTVRPLTKAIQVLQRDCMCYALRQPTAADKQNVNGFPTPPIMYKYEQIYPDKAVMDCLAPHYNLMKAVNDSQAIAQRAEREKEGGQPEARLSAEETAIAALEVEKGRDVAARAAQDQKLAAETQRSKGEMRSPPDSYEYGSVFLQNTQGRALPQCLLIGNDEFTPELKDNWQRLQTVKQRFLLSAFEALDVLVGALYLQDYETAGENYEKAVKEGLIHMHKKIDTTKAPRFKCGRNKEIASANFMYHNVKDWETSDVRGKTPEWRAACHEAKQLAKQRLSTPPDTPKKEEFQPSPLPRGRFTSPVRLTHELANSPLSPLKGIPEESDEYKTDLIKIVLKRQVDHYKKSLPTTPGKPFSGRGRACSQKFYDAIKLHRKMYNANIEQSHYERQMEQLSLEEAAGQQGAGGEQFGAVGGEEAQFEDANLL